MADLTTQALNVTRVQTHAYKYTVTGLLPNTNHNVYYDGIDHGYATRPWGGEYGDTLTSDENGELLIEMLIEIEFNREQNFELPHLESIAQQERTTQQQERRSFRVVQRNVTIEVKSANELSYAQIIQPQNTLLIPGSIRTMYPIE